MKIGFVQPETEYQIRVHRYALAQTFPQMISSFALGPNEYEIYIFGKSAEPFEDFLIARGITHVFITSITSTFRMLPSSTKITVSSISSPSVIPIKIC